MQHVPQTVFVVAVHALIRSGDRYLVVRRSDTASYMAGRWELPGGKVEPGEEVEDALVREITEETSITVHVGPPISVHTNRDSLPYRQHVEITYLCGYESGSVQLNPVEHDSYKWMSVSELRALGGGARAFLRDLLSAHEIFAVFADKRTKGNAAADRQC